MKRIAYLLILLGLSVCNYANAKNVVDKKKNTGGVEQQVLSTQEQLLQAIQNGLKDPNDDNALKDVNKVIRGNVKPQEQFLLKRDSVALANYGLKMDSRFFDVYKTLTKPKGKQSKASSYEFSYEKLSLRERKYFTKQDNKGRERVDSSECIIPIAVLVHSKIDKEQPANYEVSFEWRIILDDQKLKKSELKSITAKEIRPQVKEPAPVEQPPKEAVKAPVAEAPVADSGEEPSEEILKPEPIPAPVASVTSVENEDLRIIRTNETYRLLSAYIKTMSEYMLHPEAVAGKIIDMFDNANSVVEVSNCNRASISQREANQYFSQLKPGKINIDVKSQDFNDDFTEIIYTIGQAYDNEHYCDFTEKQVHIRYSFAKKRFVIERITVAPGHTQKCE